jgi:hypothetical protein
MAKKEDILLGEVDAPYKKEKKKKKSARSDHKHTYVPCVFSWKQMPIWGDYPRKEYESHGIGSYCSICGKVGDLHYLWKGDWVDDYDGLPQFKLESPIDKFVTLK